MMAGKRCTANGRRAWAHVSLLVFVIYGRGVYVLLLHMVLVLLKVKLEPLAWGSCFCFLYLAIT
jgi:hypothetical protein